MTKLAKKSIGAILTLRDNDFKTKMRKTNKDWDKFQAQSRKSKKAMTDFEKASKRAGDGVKSLTKTVAGGAFALAGISTAAGVFGKGINEASDLEGYRNTLDIVMKDTKKAAQTMRWAVNFANKTPFKTGAVVEATAKLQAYGVTAKKVLPAIGNMAGTMNKDLDQAVEAIADAQTGELERLKEFGITKQMIIDEGNRIMRGKEIVNQKGQITDQEAFNKALFSLMDERFKGGMQKQAASFKGIMSTISGVFSTSLAEMAGISAEGSIRAGSLFDTIKKKAKEAGDTLQKWQSDGTLKQIGNDFTTAFNIAVKAGGGFVSLLKFMKKHSNVLIPVLGGVTAAITAFKVINTVNMLMTVWKASTISATIAQHGLNAALRANPIGLVITAIGLLVAAGIYLYRNWDTVREKTESVWRSITNSIKSGVNTGIKYINMLIDGLNVIPGVNISHIKKLALTGKTGSKAAFRQIDGSHAAGLRRVPFNGYVAELHTGERVLTRQEANTYDNRSKANIEINMNGSNLTTRQVLNELIPELKLALANL